MLVHLNHFRLPLVKVDTLDLGDVYLQLSVLSRAPEAHESAEGNRGPPRGLRMAIRALAIVRQLQQGLQDLDLLVYVHL